MSESIESSSLDATLKGKVVTREVNGRKESILQHRGIKFGTIPARFAKAFPKDNWDAQVVNCDAYGYIFPIVSSACNFLTALQTAVSSKRG